MLKTKKIITVFILICLLLSAKCFATTGTVNAPSGLVLRESASKSADPITTVENNATVEILETLDEWYKVKYNGDEGYLYKQYVNVKEEAVVETPEETTTADTTTEVTEEEIQETITQINEEIYPKEATTLRAGKVYIMPSITSTVINTIDAEKKVTITKGLNSWIYITTEDGISGWVRKAVVETAASTVEQPVEEQNIEEQTTTTETTFEARKGYVNVSSSANVRSEASTSASVVTSLSRNTEINIVGESGDWYKITYGDYTGYISKDLVSDTKLPEDTSRSTVERGANEITQTTATTTSTQSETSAPAPAASISSAGGQKIVDFARQYIGYGYAYGGTTPSNGFDCSGFVYYVFNSCGYPIGRTCGAQMKSGVTVSRSELQPGDIIYFNNTSDGSIGHAAIYAGNGTIIHAANSRRGVTTDTINSGYYNTYYYTAIRVAY